MDSELDKKRTVQAVRLQVCTLHDVPYGKKITFYTALEHGLLDCACHYVLMMGRVVQTLNTKPSCCQNYDHQAIMLSKL